MCIRDRIHAEDDGPGVNRLAEMHLKAVEIEIFRPHHGREVRKNRFYHEYDRHLFAFDVFLGKLWGLNTFRVDFATLDEMLQFCLLYTSPIPRDRTRSRMPSSA